MKLQASIAVTLSLTFALQANATNPGTPTANPAPVVRQIQQSSTGCGSANITENSGQIQVAVQCQKVIVVGLKTHMTSLEINQERLLLAQNPTELRITNASLRRWLPDGQRMSLSLEFENPRDIPVPEIEIDFLDPDSGGSIPLLKPMPFSQSEVYREVGSHKFALGAHGKTTLPVAFLDEIVRRQPPNSGLCAFDAALTSDEPIADPGQPKGSSSSIKHQALLVRARFKTIFDQQVSFTQWVWVVFGQGSEGRQFWYPSKQRWDTLNCAL